MKSAFHRIAVLEDEPSIRWFIERATVSVCAAGGTRTSFPPELRGAVRAGLVRVALGIVPPEPLGRIAQRRVISGDAVVFSRDMLVGIVSSAELQPELPGQLLTDQARKRAEARRRREAKIAVLGLIRDALGRTPASPEGSVLRTPVADENPYGVLGLAADATRAHVKRARLALLRQYHPDKVATLGAKIQQLAEEESKRINRAADALENALTR